MKYVEVASLSVGNLMKLLFCRLLAQNGACWESEDLCCSPGPIQFEGPGADGKTVTLSVEDQDYVGRIQELQKYLDQVLRSLSLMLMTE